MPDVFSTAHAMIPFHHTTDLVPLSESVGDQFLRLRLPTTTALILLQQTTEVLTVAIDKVVAIPHLPGWVMGIYNWRGEILWIVDLGHLCGLTPWYQQATNRSVHTVVVLQLDRGNPSSARSEKKKLGVVVNDVETIEWCSLDWIQEPPPSVLNSPLAAFLQGYWWKTDDEVFAVLDGSAIFNAMPQA